MKHAEMKRFRMKIELELSQLERSTTALRSAINASSEETPTVFMDELDCAKGESDLNTTVSVHNCSIAHQSELTAALDRIESGTFGTCKLCQDEINLERLNANPAATMCLECQCAAEQSLARRRGINTPSYMDVHPGRPPLTAVA